MRVRRSAALTVVEAPAKLNLFFEVLARREDGYHEIETLMCPIDLFDTLSFKEDRNGTIELRCQQTTSFAKGRGSTHDPGTDDALPEGPENLACRAVELLRRRAGVRRGAKMLLVKRIPIAAGLGGGSSDAAAALIAAEKSWGLGLSRTQLAELAAELGSDVPFFLAGGAAVCRGRGERLTPVCLPCRLHFVVVRPPAGLSTASVYARCRPAQQPSNVEPILSALRRANPDHIGRLLFNRLQPAAETLTPWIRRLSEQFARQAIPGHGMSGSGTAYFGLCRSAAHARRVARRIGSRIPGRVFAVQSCR